MLVGAGPGDPRLLTLMGADALRDADVVVYDDLVNPALLAHARPGALLVRAGKRAGLPSIEQEEINRLLVSHARRGRLVVRLKGGDPFVFGRGGEEVEALARENIECEIVPGVSSGIGVAGRAGIPLTHRDLASSVAFVTASQSRDKSVDTVDWRAMAGVDTLVVFMCARSIGRIATRLVEAGRSPETPVAVVSRGTRDDEERFVTTLGEIAELDGASEANAPLFPSPAIAIVGAVATFPERIAALSRTGEEVSYDEIVA
jgi:uroporphyrin-III C-methyltransferase